jgi:hypothetical protein
MATYTVILLKNSSRPFFLPKKVSAPPAIAPDSPALLPDCNRITAISPKQSNTCNIVKIILPTTLFSSSLIKDILIYLGGESKYLLVAGHRSKQAPEKTIPARDYSQLRKYKNLIQLQKHRSYRRSGGFPE